MVCSGIAGKGQPDKWDFTEYLKFLRLKEEVPVGRRGFTSAGTYVLQSYSLLM